MLDIVASYYCMQFQVKPMNQSWENNKKPSFGPNFFPFGPNLGHQIFFSKIRLNQSVDIMVSYHHVQYQKKLMIQSWENVVTDRQTKWEWFHRTLFNVKKVTKDTSLKLHKLDIDLRLLPKRMNIKIYEKLCESNLHNNENYFIRIKPLKLALNHGLILEKVHKVMEFNKEAWLKPWLMNSSDLRKTIKNLRKTRYTKLVTINKIKSFSISANCHSTKWFLEYLRTIEMNKTKSNNE